MKKIILLSLLIVSSTTIDKPTFDLNKAPNQVEIFAPDIISTGLFERDIAISPKGNEIIYTLSNYDQTLRCLVKMEKKNNSWGAKQILSFSGRYNDIEPFFTVDGNQLYFASDRPIDMDSTRTDYNIWVCNKSNGTWINPKPLDTIINTKGDEFYPSLSKNGNLYFTATRENGIGREDIFTSKNLNGTFQNPVVLDSTINTATYEFNAFISPNEDLLIFSSFRRPDGLGGGDLYYSKKDENDNWKTSTNLGELINSKKLDYCPFVDFNSGNFYFTSSRTIEPTVETFNTVSEFIDNANNPLNGMGNIYRISLDKLPFN